MRRQSMVVMVVVAVWMALLPGAAQADSVAVNPANGHVYEVVPLDGESWNAANAAAEASTYQGAPGHLVSITSAEEQTFVEGLLADHEKSAYIGLTDQEVEGTFVWTTGEETGYQNWAGGEPNNFFDEDCSAAYGGRFPDESRRGTWNDVECEGGANYTATYFDSYIVEYDGPFDADGDGIPDTAPPADKDACKKGGWATFNNPSFRNQGQCVSWVNHHT